MARTRQAPRHDHSFMWLLLFVAVVAIAAKAGGRAITARLHHTAAAPKPAPARTVIVHTVTRVLPQHSPVSGTDIVLMVLGAMACCLVIFLNLRSI